MPSGLDPCLGCLHAVVGATKSLDLDLIEPLRPGVDAMCLALLADGLEPDSFFKTKDGRGLFYDAWGRQRADWACFGMMDEESGLSAETASSRTNGLAQRVPLVQSIRLFLDDDVHLPVDFFSNDQPKIAIVRVIELEPGSTG